MRVLLDATSMPPDRHGVARYVLGLVRELASRVDLHVVAKRRDAAELEALRATVHPVALRSRPSRLMWEQTLLPVLVRRVAPDVFHGPHYTLPVVRCPSVVTFHDPTFFTMPEVHERAKVAYFTRMTRVSIKRAARIIAMSRYSSRGAVEHAGADPDRVDVVYQGVDATEYRADGNQGDEDLRQRLGVRPPYLFWVGAIEPRKGGPALVRAFAKLAANGSPHALVLAGAPKWGADQLDEAIGASGVADRIVRPGYVSDAEKCALYRGADALVYPSIAEGFGRQVLEAMACGCPVVTTTGSAPEEVGGDAVMLVAPRDEDALQDAIARVLGDPSVAGELRRRGLERAASFTWTRTAEETIESYRAALR